MKPLQNLHNHAVEQAMIEAKAKNPGLPDWKLKTLIKVPEYSDRNDKGLIVCIMDFLKFSGWFAERLIHNEWYKDNAPVQTADISFKMQNTTVFIEVQTSDYKRADYARDLFKEKMKLGSLYILVRSFDDFLGQYERLLLSIRPNATN